MSTKFVPVSTEEVKAKMAIPPNEPLPVAAQPTSEKPVVEVLKAEAPKVEVPKVDPKPIEKAEEKPVEEKPTRKKIKEVAKPFFETKEKIVEKQEEIPDTIKPKLAEYEKQIAEYKKIAEDRDVQIILEAKKSGKDIFGILKEVQGDDPSKYTLAELKEMELKEQGLEGDDLAEALEDFNDKKPYLQKAETNSYRKKLEAAQEEKKTQFLSLLKEGSEQKAQDTQRHIAAVQKTEAEFNRLCDEWVGKEHYSVVGTPQMAKDMKEFLNDPDGLIPRNEDGSLNAQRLFDLVHYIKYGDLRLENLENQFFAKGYEELEKEVSARGDAARIVRAPSGTPSGNEDVGKKVFQTIRPVLQ